MESFESNPMPPPIQSPQHSPLQSPPQSLVQSHHPDPTVTDLDHEAANTLHQEFDHLDLKQAKDNSKDLSEDENRENGKGEEEGKNEDLDCNVRDGVEIENEYENGLEDVGWNDEDENGEKVVDDDDAENGERSYRKYQQYPERPDAEDCAFYLKTGNCKFGLNCKFNHPPKINNQPLKEKMKECDEFIPGQTECKYYSRTGGCKFGKACRYNHPRGKTLVTPILDLNFIGLPIRPGEKECPFYMRTGSCKYGVNCKFNHPDPTAAGGCDSPSEYSNGGSVPLHDASESTTSWSSPKTLNETAPFVPMMFSPPQMFSSRAPEWNGFRAPVYLPERSTHPAPAYLMNNSTTEAGVYTHHQHQMLTEEFPERPGQPECSYFLKTGDCKYKSNCKYHHPKNRLPKSPPCVLSDKGLPLRPDRNICTHYSRYGICKFGPACKYDHSIEPASSGLDLPLPFSHSATTDGARLVGGGSGTEALVV